MPTTTFIAIGFRSILGSITTIFGSIWARLNGEKIYGEEIPIASYFRELNPIFAVFLLLTPSVVIWILGALFPHGF